MINIAQRHKYILDKLKEEDYVKVQELSEALQVSEVTIRKDLKYLEKKKLLSRNHGSASSILSIIPDRHISEKEKIQVEEKCRIAEKAKTLIEPNDKIIIASGTTTLALANAMSTITIPCTVITPSIKVSLALCNNPNIEIIQLGGTLRKNAASVAGKEAESILNNMSCNKLFFGVDGLDLDYGYTTSCLAETQIHQQMIHSSQKHYVLLDAMKFGKRGFCKICNVNEIQHIVTDDKAPMHVVNRLSENAIEVIIA